MDIFSVISKHVDWLSQRQAVTAANIANLDTPGYKAKSIEGFDPGVGVGHLRMIGTQPDHMGVLESEGRVYAVEDSPVVSESLSGNTVNLELEMMTVGQTAKQFSIDTGLAKLFHRLVMTSLKG